MEIDENSLREAPGFFKRILNTFLGIIFSAVLVQVIHIAFKSFTSIILLFNQWWFIGILIVGGIFGYFFGDQFHGWLRNKMAEWNIWNY